MENQVPVSGLVNLGAIPNHVAEAKREWLAKNPGGIFMEHIGQTPMGAYSKEQLDHHYDKDGWLKPETLKT